jgi:hypothetical protein
MIEHEYLNLPPSLAKRFDDWIEWHFRCMPDLDGDNFNWKAFNSDEFQLARDLKRFLGFNVYVECDGEQVPFDLTVFADYGCGLWTRTGGIFLESLHPAEKLLNEFDMWLTEFERSIGSYVEEMKNTSQSKKGTKNAIEEFDNRGWRLSLDIKRLLSQKAIVRYRSVADWVSLEKIE